MPKFTFLVEETAVFSYVIDAENEDTARDLYDVGTLQHTGKFVEGVESSILSITKSEN